MEVVGSVAQVLALVPHLRHFKGSTLFQNENSLTLAKMERAWLFLICEGRIYLENFERAGNFQFAKGTSIGET